MKILIVEDDPSRMRFYRDAFARLMPEAMVDIVTSFGGYLRNAADVNYDAYVMNDTIADDRQAFWDIAPLIQKRFPDAVLLHNSSNMDPDYIRNVERLAKIRFARGPDGKVVTCNKQFPVILEFLRTMVVGKEDAKQKPTLERSPACQSMRFHTEPRVAFRCCRP